MTSIIAHRGASRYAPENSFPAFKLAYEMKADGIETDVQLTKDNIPVLFHDESLKRIFGEKGWVNQYTLEQLKQLDMGKSFHPKFTGTSILSLEEFLAWIKDKPLMLHLELKNNKIEYKNLEEITYQLIEQYQMTDRTYFSTFSNKSITRLASFKKNFEYRLVNKTNQTGFISICSINWSNSYSYKAHTFAAASCK